MKLSSPVQHLQRTCDCPVANLRDKFRSPSRAENSRSAPSPGFSSSPQRQAFQLCHRERLTFSGCTKTGPMFQRVQKTVSAPQAQLTENGGRSSCDTMTCLHVSENSGCVAGAVHRRSGGRSSGDTKSGPNGPESSQDSVGAAVAVHRRNGGYPSCAAETKFQSANCSEDEGKSHKFTSSTERHVLVMMQHLLPTIREHRQRTMSSTQVRYPGSVRSKVLSALGPFPDFGTITEHGNISTKYLAFSLDN